MRFIKVSETNFIDGQFHHHPIWRRQSWCGTRSSDRLLWTWQWTFRGIFWLAEEVYSFARWTVLHGVSQSVSWKVPSMIRTKNFIRQILPKCNLRDSEIRYIELKRTFVEGTLESHESHVCICGSKISVSTVLIARFVCLFLARQSPRGPGPPLSRGFYITRNEDPQSVGLLWTSDQLVAETSTWEHTTLTTNIHAPVGIRTHNISRRAAEDLRLRPRGRLDRLIARLHTSFTVYTHTTLPEKCHVLETNHDGVWWKAPWTILRKRADDIRRELQLLRRKETMSTPLARVWALCLGHVVILPLCNANRVLQHFFYPFHISNFCEEKCSFAYLIHFLGYIKEQKSGTLELTIH